MLKTSLICSSLKYLSKNYNSIVDVSKWIYFELTKYNYKETKFIESLDNKDFEIIKTLIKFNDNIELLSRYLIKYCWQNNNYFNIVKLLVENGADVHFNYDYSFKLAIYFGHYNIVKLFIDNGINVLDHQTITLTMASCRGYYKIVKLLIDNGVNKSLDEALKDASEYGYFDIVKLLIENGANIYVDNNYALRLANYNHHIDIVNFLESYL